MDWDKEITKVRCHPERSEGSFLKDSSPAAQNDGVVMMSFVLNLPYTLVRLIIGVLSLPEKFLWHAKSRTIIIEVKSFWWAKGWKMKGLRGTTSGHTVLLLSKKIESFDLEHELIHVRQYDEYPLIFPLLYWYELLKNGYRKNKFEDEAYRIAGNVYKEK